MKRKNTCQEMLSGATCMFEKQEDIPPKFSWWLFLGHDCRHQQYARRVNSIIDNHRYTTIPCANTHTNVSTSCDSLHFLKQAKSVGTCLLHIAHQNGNTLQANSCTKQGWAISLVTHKQGVTLSDVHLVVLERCRNTLASLVPTQDKNGEWNTIGDK